MLSGHRDLEMNTVFTELFADGAKALDKEVEVSSAAEERSHPNMARDGVCRDGGCPCSSGRQGRKMSKKKPRHRDGMSQEERDNALEKLAAGLPLDEVIAEEPLHMLCEDAPLNQVESEPKWRKITSVMDSGEADSVAPETVAPWIPTGDSLGSQKGQHYLSASGDRLPNLGQKRLEVVTDEGMPTTTTYQIADVTRPLCAVSKSCDQGNIVVFMKDGGFAQAPNGVRTKFRRDRNVYLLDTWIREPVPGFTGPC